MTFNKDSNKGINSGHDITNWQYTLVFPGILLSPLGDLSHTSILYYYIWNYAQLISQLIIKKMLINK
jgi:hypothetical protein